MTPASSGLLAMSLSVAVPLWIEEFRHLSFDEIQKISNDSAQIVAEKGDVIQFKSTKKGESAAAFNALARGIACLAFAPGGVTTFGSHWEAKRDAAPDRETDGYPYNKGE